jgi:hypothetical protein
MTSLGIKLAVSRTWGRWTTRRLTMRMHVIFVLLGLIAGACASKREVASSQKDREIIEQIQHAQMIDGQAARIR